VHIAAFAPDSSESVSALVKSGSAPGAPVLPIMPPVDGYRERAGRHDQRSGMEDEAPLVSADDRRQDDSCPRAAADVKARRRDRRRGRYRNVATASLLENWIAEAERRIWFLAEVTRDS